MSLSVLPVFSCKSFIVSGLTFRSLIHFDFIFVYEIRKCSNFILLHVSLKLIIKYKSIEMRKKQLLNQKEPGLAGLKIPSLTRLQMMLKVRNDFQIKMQFRALPKTLDL